MHVTLTLMFHSLFYVNSFYLRTERNIAEEVQNAICQITTKDLEASANATITRQLKGVCTSDELNSKLDKLEQTILQKIDDLKETLNLDLLDVSNSENITFKTYSNSGNNRQDKYIKKIDLKPETPSRINDILMYNDTIKESNRGNIYMYYWRIQNIHELLIKVDMYKSSPNFFVLGHSLKLLLYPNHLERNYFAIQLKPFSKGFIKKHRISIINKFHADLDIDSGMLFGTKSNEAIFRLSMDSIKEEGFIYNDSMIVNVQIYLDS